MSPRTIYLNRDRQSTAMRHFAANSEHSLGEPIVHIRHDQEGREITRDHGNQLLIRHCGSHVLYLSLVHDITTPPAARLLNT